MSQNSCQMPSRLSLLKRKRRCSDEEDPENAELFSDSVEKKIFNDENYMPMADRITEVHFNSGTKGELSSELAHASDQLSPLTCESSCTWKNETTYVFTPESERTHPLPLLNWADPGEVWALMCLKDTASSDQRNEDMFQNHPLLQARMRAILLDWLIEVCEVYKLHRETFHLTMDYIDRYLSNQSNIPKQQLQLIGITCLFIAAKVEEIYPPKITEFAYVTDGACTEAEILDKELVILKALNWNLSPVTVNGWLNTYMQLSFSDQESEASSTFVFPHYSGQVFVQTSQLVDLCMLDEGSLRYPYSHIAAGAMYHMFSKTMSLQASGLSWEEMEACVLWMSAFAITIREEGDEYLTKDLSSTPSSLDDSHNIQNHVVDLPMLERAQERLSVIKTSSDGSFSPTVLTPPSSHKKVLTHQMALTETRT